MRRLLFLTVCLAVAALGNAPSARAIVVTITYSIGSGDFNGPFSSGPITGGTLVVSYPNAVSLFAAPPPLASVSLLALTLTGPSGFFQVPASVFTPSPQPVFSAMNGGVDYARVECLAPYCTPRPLISGMALLTSTWTNAHLVWNANGPAWMPRTRGRGGFYQGPCYGKIGCRGYPDHRFSFSPSSGFEVSRTCDTPPCPVRTPLPTPSPTPLPRLVGDIPMCKSKRGMQVTVLVPPSKMQRLLDKGVALGECLNPTNGRVLCKTKRGMRRNVLLPDSKVQRALGKGFCTLGECGMP